MTKIPVTRKSDVHVAVPIVDELSKRIETVREHAYRHFLERGGNGGSDLDDWCAAEREVLGAPPAILKERDGEYEIEVALAGFTPADIDVVADRDELIVHATCNHASSKSDDSVVWSEFRSDEVFRRLPLPSTIDDARVSARLDNGMLRIHAPKVADGAAAQQHVGAAG